MNCTVVNTTDKVDIIVGVCSSAYVSDSGIFLEIPSTISNVIALLIVLVSN